MKMFKVSNITTNEEWYFPNIALAFFFVGSFFEKEITKIIDEDETRIVIKKFFKCKKNYIEIGNIGIERIDY